VPDQWVVFRLLSHLFVVLLSCVRSPTTSQSSLEYLWWDATNEYLFPMTPKARGRTTIFLRSNRDIETVKHHGRRISTALFNLLAYKMDDAPSRVGIIVGKRFGNAVRRNRMKRVFRELVRQLHRDLVPGRGLLVFPKRDALFESREELTQAWKTSLERMHLLRPKLN
jgi:ribonuclease P protein component